MGAISPIFSIGIPTYDRIELLRHTVLSILNQTFKNFEILIANDCTQKKLTYKKLGLIDKRIKIINNEENLGEAGNLNFLLTQAYGEYFTWQFDDDIYFNTFFESVYNLFQHKNDLACIYTNLGYIYGKKYPETISKNKTKHNIYNGVDFVNKVFQGSISAAGCCGVFNRLILNEIGGVEKISETPIAIHSEFLLIVHLVKYKEIGYIKTPLFFSRDYEETFSGSTKDYQSYKIAGLNLLKRGISIYYSYCSDVNKRLDFLIALINTIMEFYIMRLASVNIINHSYEIRKFYEEILDTLQLNKNHISKKEINYLSNIYKKKRWVKIRIKAILKWHSPKFLNIIFKKIRASISKLNI